MKVKYVPQNRLYYVPKGSYAITPGYYSTNTVASFIADGKLLASDFDSKDIDGIVRIIKNLSGRIGYQLASCNLHAPYINDLVERIKLSEL